MANSKYSVELNDFFKDMGRLTLVQLYLKQSIESFVSRCEMLIPKIKDRFFRSKIPMIHTLASVIMPFEMHIYGSSVEGLGCCTRYDMGDIDIMLCPTEEEAILDESMLDYVDGEPAFVRVRGKDHPLLQKCLHGETNFVATSTLKEMDSTFFGWASMLIKIIMKVFGSFLQHHTPDFEVPNLSEGLENDGPSFTLEFLSKSSGTKHQIPIESIADVVPDYPKVPNIQRFSAKEISVVDATPCTRKVYDIISTVKANPTNEELLKAIGVEKFFNTILQSIDIWKELKYELYEAEQEDKDTFDEEFMTDILSTFMKSLQARQPWDMQKQEKVLQEKPMKRGFDVVPSFKVKGWPQVAQGWFERDRKWPSFEALSNIRKGGFHLVFKSPKHGNTTPHLDFRLSFSHAELLLSKELNDIQRECYRCLKLFYKVLNQNQEPKIISSYVLKTTLLWTVENTGVEEWNENNRASCMMMLLEKLHHSLETKFLPHYFIPEFNLLEEAVIEYPQQLQNLAGEVREICDNPAVESYQKKLITAEINSSSSEEFKEKSESPPEGLVKQSGTFQFKAMPKKEFAELYFDVSKEIASWVKCGRYSDVEEPTMQSIVSFLHKKVKLALGLDPPSSSDDKESCEYSESSELGSESSEYSESSEVDGLIREVMEEYLPDLDYTYIFFHVAYKGRLDPRERMLYVIKTGIELFGSKNEEKKDYKNILRYFVKTNQSFFEESVEAALDHALRA
ncbi:uncharacterized protein LOC110251686 [Exaiptasia diaphana]|uniref:Mab-21-like HhH/H2TH-like domain-containing protein n=1 Tax=Exaiptasia diaphana TaxID=2652724 RepID=A0A913Y384_EXADI|nr:uncharacterized protein LOC110251686 [Exaiptasia diaphana]KXJ07062.1 Protein mab-21-like 3 [Exaiptasia diaphana]